jgi:hypothetical protein
MGGGGRVKRTKTPRPDAWRDTNPHYQPGGVRRVRIPHRETGELVECVEVDAGTWPDYLSDQRVLNPKRFQR